MEEAVEGPALWRYDRRVEIDYIDLEVIGEKEEFAYAPISLVAKRLRISQQRVSYHFRRHVKPLWMGNYLEWRTPMPGYVYVLYRITSIDYPSSLKLARLLSQIPWLIDGFIARNSERNIIALLGIPYDELISFHKTLLKLGEASRLVPLAYLDPESLVHHRLSAEWIKGASERAANGGKP